MDEKQFEFELEGRAKEDDMEIIPASQQEKPDCKICGVEIGYGNCRACSKEKAKEDLKNRRKVA